MKTIHIDHPQAAAALYAANHGYKHWGAYAARMYAIKHNALRLYVLARQLAAATKEGF